MRILFYDDAVQFGGHEVLTLAAARHAAAQPGIEVGFIHCRRNLRLSSRLEELAARHPGFTSLPQDYASQQFQVFRTLVSGRAIRAIAARMTIYSPDVVVIAQGAIAYCSAGLMAARRLGVLTLSYIPLAHPESVFSASRIKAALREVVNRLYYRIPDEYITISPRMVDYLRRRGLKQPVTVVRVALDVAALRDVDRGAARSSLGFSAEDLVIAVLGRVELWHKRQDLAIEALALARPELPKLKLLVVGDGPDLPALKELARSEGVHDAVVFLAWTDDASPIYTAIDALVIPSRYEGVPLVMLTAMYFRRPVIASAVDGMADVLPERWLFPSGDASALAARVVQAVREDQAALLETHRELVTTSYSKEAFERTFLTAVISAAERRGTARRS